MIAVASARRGLGAALLACVFALPSSAQEYKAPLTQINVTSTTHSTVSDGSGVLVGILDTLADASHPELSGRLSTATYSGGVYTKPGTHGTHVAGIIGAAANGTGMVGVAPNVSMVNVAVFDDRGWYADTNAANAFAYVRNAGATVVNMSYGPTLRGDLFLNGELGVLAAYNDTMVMVRAAGNHGANLFGETLPFGVTVAQLDHILIVGSVDAQNKISSFSNKPGNACWGNTFGICSKSNKIMNSFIVAPGQSVYSTIPGGYGTLSGTSMATPHVTGAVALLQSEWPHLKADPGSVVSILKQTAKDLGTKGVDKIYGFGLLDVAKALQPVGTTTVATGSTVGGGGTSLSGSGLKFSSAVPKAAAIEAAVADLVVFDDFGRDFAMQPSFESDSDDAELMLDRLTALGGVLAQQRQGFAVGTLASSFTAAGTIGNEGFSQVSFAAGGSGFTFGFGEALGGAAGLVADEATAHGLLQQELSLGLGAVTENLQEGFYAAGSLALAPGLKLAAFYTASGTTPAEAAADPAAMLMEDDDPTSSLMAVKLSYEPLGGLVLGASYSRLEEEGAFLGSESGGAFALGDVAHTDMVGLSAALRLDRDLSLLAFYQEAWSSGEADASSIFGDVDDWRSRRYGMALGLRNAVEAGDWLEFSLVRPLAVYSGTGEALVPVGRTDDGTVVYETTSYDLGNSAEPIELGLTYLGAGGEWAPGRDYRYGLQLNWTDDDVTSGAADGTLGVIFALKASF